MSTRVVAGISPAGRPHPTAKWGLLMALLVVVVLGVPKIANAGQPQVQPPTGPQSGGVFTGTFTFVYYIYCTSGPTYSSSYSSSMEGTNTFTFYGAPDGSLFLSINSGGNFLLQSCGDPFTGSQTVAASYTVTKYASGPPPTPTPPPTSTPTPPPTSGGGGGGTHPTGGSSSHASGAGGSSAPGASAAPEPPTPAPTPEASPPTPGIAPPTPKPASMLIEASGTLVPALGLATIPIGHATMNAARTSFVLLVLLIISIAWWRHRHPRDPLVPTRRDRLALRAEPYVFKLRMLGKRLSRWFKRHFAARHKDQIKRRGLSPHAHSGKLTAHHHTSYPALAFLLLLSGVLATAATVSTFAASSSSLLSLTVQGAPPATGATIDTPTSGEHFSTSSTTVRGGCPTGVFVEIWRNGSFAGSTICDLTGLYSVIITLLPNQNDLVARVSDALGQYGPDSATVSVYYDVPPPPTPTPTPSPNPTPSPTAGPTPAPTLTPTPHPTPTSRPHTGPTPTPLAPAPLIITSNRHFYQGSGPGDDIQWQLSVSGGAPPYRVSWDWGDGTSDTATATGPGEITNHHAYDTPGAYELTVTVKDARGSQAVIQLVTMVAGPTGAAPLTSKPDPGNLIFIWPLLVVAVLLTASFWLGERHKLAIAQPSLAI